MIEEQYFSDENEGGEAANDVSNLKDKTIDSN